MLLSLCLLLPALSPSSQEICSAPGDLPAPTLQLSQTSAQPGDTVQLQCSVISQLLATRIVFCEFGEEVLSQRGLLGKSSYDYDHTVPMGSSRNYSCGYEIKGSDNQVNRSQLSPAQHLNITSALRAPILHLNQTSAQPGDSVRLQCSVFSWPLATHIIFYKDGEEVSSQNSSLGNLTYHYDHAVSEGSFGNYSCGYEIKDSDNQVIKSRLSPAQHLSVTARSPSSQEICLAIDLLLALTIWAVRGILVLLLLVSAPIITFMLKKCGLPRPAGLEETHSGSASILQKQRKLSRGPAQSPPDSPTSSSFYEAPLAQEPELKPVKPVKGGRDMAPCAASSPRPPGWSSKRWETPSVRLPRLQVLAPRLPLAGNRGQGEMQGVDSGGMRRAAHKDPYTLLAPGPAPPKGRYLRYMPYP
nr:uncharacterized protein LOC102462722 [Pelodiscus sinensis]|eukprot:XP_025036243.1 uncharacterized protein LOC102462722 [Pelodiscus sinensis]